MTTTHNFIGETTMKTAFCVLAMLVMSAPALAEVPPGPDSVNGAFERMLAHGREEPRPLLISGKPDPLATTIASALLVQRAPQQLPKGAAIGWTAP